jgi:N-acetylmuramoyl-L-alanine amidase
LLSGLVARSVVDRLADPTDELGHLLLQHTVQEIAFRRQCTARIFPRLAGARRAAVVSSPAVTRKAFVGAVVALLAHSPLAAQEAAPDPTDIEPTPILAQGTGTLAIGGELSPLPWVDVAGGTLVLLEPLVTQLGGRLVEGLLGASYELHLGDASFVLAPGSAALVRGAEILSISTAPRVVAGRLYVPVDFVARVWGTVAGVESSWDPTARRLSASRPTARELPVEVSLVHLQEVTTLVLRFPSAPRVRIEERSWGYEVIAVGDRFRPPPARAVEDPHLRALSVTADRIRIDVAPGVEAEHYRLGAPDRIVFDLYRARGETAGGTLPAPRPAERRGIRTVVLDPGHGGAETGAVGPAGTMEKELTLLVARALADRLASELGVRVVLTRTDDIDLGLDERSALANQSKADLFLSIHFNSAARGDADGAETYFLSLQASDVRAADAAAIENFVGGAAALPGAEDFDLQLILWDLAQSRHLAASQRLASQIQEELNRQLGLPDRGVKQAPFRVLMGAGMPAVLVELGFLSTRSEEQRLRDPVYRAELVGALLRAIARFKSEQEAATGATGAPR